MAISPKNQRSEKWNFPRKKLYVKKSRFTDSLDAADVIVMLQRVDKHIDMVAKALAPTQGRWYVKRQGVGDGSS